MTDLTDALGGRFPLPRETRKRTSSLLRDRKGRIRTKDPARDRTLKLFLAAFLVIGIAAMLLMKIDWLQFCEGLVRIPEALGKLIQIDFSQIDITFSSLLESIGVAVLSTVYSMVGGMILAVFLAKNLTPFKWVATVLSAALTFRGPFPPSSGYCWFWYAWALALPPVSSASAFSAPPSLPGPLPNALKRCPRKH